MWICQQDRYFKRIDISQNKSLGTPVYWLYDNIYSTPSGKLHLLICPQPILSFCYDLRRSSNSNALTVTIIPFQRTCIYYISIGLRCTIYSNKVQVFSCIGNFYACFYGLIYRDFSTHILLNLKYDYLIIRFRPKYNFKPIKECYTSKMRGFQVERTGQGHTCIEVDNWK